MQVVVSGSCRSMTVSLLLLVAMMNSAVMGCRVGAINAKGGEMEQACAFYINDLLGAIVKHEEQHRCPERRSLRSGNEEQNTRELNTCNDCCIYWFPYCYIHCQGYCQRRRDLSEDAPTLTETKDDINKMNDLFHNSGMWEFEPPYSFIEGYIARTDGAEYACLSSLAKGDIKTFVEPPN